MPDNLFKKPFFICPYTTLNAYICQYLFKMANISCFLSRHVINIYATLVYMEHIKQERTLVLVKPDGVQRGLIGEIISRIERRGLKVVALKMELADRSKIEKHLPAEDEWLVRLGNKGLNTFKEYNLDAKTLLGTEDPMEIGTQTKEGIIEYLTSGPVVAMVIQGMHAIDMMRKIVGHTLPFKAEMGTLRGDFSVDSPAIANYEKRSIKNIVHASETQGEAHNEMNLWFTPDEIQSYKRADEDIMF